MSYTKIQKPFNPKARLLQLLGDQLIGTKILAVFELVKNAYDADAARVTVTLRDINTENSSIVVKDYGSGMSLNTIENIWLVPGHDHKQKQKDAKERTPLKHRLPLGEKGVGRFAVHKLGDYIELVTRAEGHQECVVKINWAELIEKPFLSDAEVEINTREAQVFLGNRTGTKITISKLRENNWTRGDVRKLYRQVTSIASPFVNKSDQFRVKLLVPDYPEWLKDIPPIETLLQRAPWHFKFLIHDGKIDWEYNFRGITGLKLEPRSIIKKDEKLLLPKQYSEFSEKRKKTIASTEDQNGIGDLKGEFYIYDLDRAILKILGDTQQLQSFLDENGGVRVYRDDIRVYNYGEPNNDWLNLDVRRVNLPTKNISNNITIGAIEVSLADSLALKEKTNREGFVENEEFVKFKSLIIGALTNLEIERKIDKDKIRSITNKGHDPEADKITKPLERLRDIAKKHKIDNEINPLIDKIENDYNDMRDTMLKAGVSGMGLAIIFHEIERGVRVLQSSIENSESKESVKTQARELVRILDGFTELLRKGEKKNNSMKNLIKRSRDLNKIRFRVHKIHLVAPFLEESIEDIQKIFSFSLILGGLNNLIDNAIHWLKVRWPDETQDLQRKIYIDVVSDFKGGPAIIVADNGPGFTDDPERLTKPFFSRRPDGMGLGLYYTNMVMELNNGHLSFPHPDELDIPEEFNGAVLALAFSTLKE